MHFIKEQLCRKPFNVMAPWYCSWLLWKCSYNKLRSHFKYEMGFNVWELKRDVGKSFNKEDWVTIKLESSPISSILWLVYQYQVKYPDYLYHLLFPHDHYINITRCHNVAPSQPNILDDVMTWITLCITGLFPSRRDSYKDCFCFFCCKLAEQSVVSDTATETDSVVILT